MKKNEKGSTALIVILIVVVIACIGLLGYRMIQNKDKDKTKTSNTTQKNTSDNTSKTDNSTANTPAAGTGSLQIKEWGVKVALRDASKVQIKVNNTSGTIFTDNAYEAEAVPSFAPGAVQDDSCTPGLGMYRSKTAFGPSVNQNKIGDYYYTITGGPGSCEKDADNQLKLRFLKDFTPENISAL